MSDKDEKATGHLGHKSNVKHVFIKNPSPPKRNVFGDWNICCSRESKTYKTSPFLLWRMIWNDIKKGSFVECRRLMSDLPSRAFSRRK